MLETPILFLIFNRTDTTQQVFEAIRQQKPRYLYVAADGPRENKAGEAEKCRQTRDIIKQIDWDCELKTLFREKNLGCGKAVSSAINWFFENVEQGIILEDDCLPHPDFFIYCHELLEKYKNNDTVKFISGDNFQDGIKRGDASYYFSGLCHVWGWASWRSTWEKYDFNLDKASSGEYRMALKEYFPEKNVFRYWNFIFNLMRKKKIDTWDYQLAFSVIQEKGLSIIPNVNLVTNIGFIPESTHTNKKIEGISDLETKPILPLTHPKEIMRNIDADNYYIRKSNLSLSVWRYIYRKLKG